MPLKPHLRAVLDRVPYGAHNDPGVGLAAVAVGQGRCRLLVCHPGEGVAYPLPAIIDITEDLSLRPSGGQAGQPPVGLPCEQRRWGPGRKFAREVVVEAFQRMPGYAPRRCAATVFVALACSA
ncbi:MAG: hypothetical protein NT075_27040 [Chloroflexi bacterium]|nr:hypothetical protein [Chloroflexota bacterium]